MTTLATNILSKATSQFKNYEFKGFLKAYGQKFGLSETGFYKLEGDSDNGTPRTASLTLSNNHFGVYNDKRFPYFYVQVYTESDFKLTFIVDDKEAMTQYVKIKKPGLQMIRIPCSRLCRGVQWALRVDVFNNGHMRLYSIKGLPVILHAGRSIT
jgi:hypothetical protein